jgi:hypothetical protein
MIYKTFSEVKSSIIGKVIYLKSLKDEFNDIEFENFENLDLRTIKSILKILRYFKDVFGENIFYKLNKIKAVEEEDPLGGFSYNEGCIRLSLKLFGEYADQYEVDKWVYPERIFIHELVHYLMSIPRSLNRQFNLLVNNLEEFVNENAYECKECCPNLTLKKREIKSIEELAEEFICEVVSSYINKIIKDPKISILEIFDKDKIQYCIVALQFYKKLKELIKNILNQRE